MGRGKSSGRFRRRGEQRQYAGNPPRPAAVWRGFRVAMSKTGQAGRACVRLEPHYTPVRRSGGEEAVCDGAPRPEQGAKGRLRGSGGACLLGARRHCFRPHPTRYRHSGRSAAKARNPAAPRRRRPNGRRVASNTALPTVSRSRAPLGSGSPSRCASLRPE